MQELWGTKRVDPKEDDVDEDAEKDQDDAEDSQEADQSSENEETDQNDADIQSADGENEAVKDEEKTDTDL